MYIGRPEAKFHPYGGIPPKIRRAETKIRPAAKALHACTHDPPNQQLGEAGKQPRAQVGDLRFFGSSPNVNPTSSTYLLWWRCPRAPCPPAPSPTTNNNNNLRAPILALQAVLLRSTRLSAPTISPSASRQPSFAHTWCRSPRSAQPRNGHQKSSAWLMLITTGSYHGTSLSSFTRR